MAPDFIVHTPSDTVGVVVVEKVITGEEVRGWVMETDETVIIKVKDEVSLGHKLALANINTGETIIKYGKDIGKAISDISFGSHVHVHNVKTKRW